MPKSGQVFDPRVFDRSGLLREFGDLTRPIAAREGWPTLEEYTEFSERQRQARAPELGRVCFARSSPARGRDGGVLELDGLYDGRIALRGEVPCLEHSYHDLFNVLVWAAFPRSKRALHARQFRALEAWVPADASRLPNRRTREQDALTLFDEGGAVLVTTRAEADRLSAGDGLRSDGLRSEVSCSGGEGPPAGGARARALLFGHAVMEHVCFETASVSAAALLLVVEDELLAAAGPGLLDHVDRALALRLSNPEELCSPAFDATLDIAPPERWRTLPPRASNARPRRA